MTKVILAAGPLDPTVSYEYHNFLKPLENLGCVVVPFDFVGFMRTLGREGMNQELLAVVQREQPELVIFVPHTDQFIPIVVDEINRHAITLGYLFDDMWRVEYSRFWAQHFTYVTTSDVNGVRKFRDAGYTNVLYSPFACNTEFHIKKSMPKLHDVSFVGQYHPFRAWCIQRLRKAGIRVYVWGMGWETGTLDYASMVNTFNQSRINLNLSNSVSWDVRYLGTLDRPIKETLRSWRDALDALRKPDWKVREQVKGRHFEINACGGFQLSYYVEGLERQYRIGEEIAVYESVDEMIDKAYYYLKHENEREAIAQRGYERTLHDHTMEQRFAALFDQIGIRN